MSHRAHLHRTPPTSLTVTQGGTPQLPPDIITTGSTTSQDTSTRTRNYIMCRLFLVSNCSKPSLQLDPDGFHSRTSPQETSIFASCLFKGKALQQTPNFREIRLHTKSNFNILFLHVFFCQERFNPPVDKIGVIFLDPFSTPVRPVRPVCPI